jgi:predicted transcriptional regulator
MVAMKYRSRRSRTDIVGSILEAANGGATKTKIMYKAFLSYSQLKEYLRVLLQNGLLEYEEGRQDLRTTQQGLHLLQTCNNLMK